MPSHRKFTAPAVPAGFETQAPFREAFLRHFTPDDAERFRYLGNLVYQAFMESANTMLPKDLPQSETWREMSAALQDLRFVQHFLAETAQGLVRSALAVDDTQLALAAAEKLLIVGDPRRRGLRVNRRAAGHESAQR